MVPPRTVFIRVPRLPAAAGAVIDQAERHFEAALALEKRLASPPNLARTRYWFARMLHGGEDPRYIARKAVNYMKSIGIAAVAIGIALTSGAPAPEPAAARWAASTRARAARPRRSAC